ncbi:MAG TPA: universal stress protein [Burkholderiaceae bacterium]|jgi:nucleotide-binding universal stress UspA family protein
MYSRILVATDGSPTSEQAIEQAARLAKDQHAQLRIVHAIEQSRLAFAAAGPVALDLEGILDALRKSGQAALDRGKAIAQQSGVEAETAIVGDDAIDDRVAMVLAAEASRWKADLVVLGTHGRRGINHLLMGSVAEAVARVAPAHVLLVRARPAQR